MNIELLREYCISLPDVEESFPFGPDTLVFKVGGKIFMLLSLDAVPPRFNLKCNPDKAIELRERYSSVQSGYHMNKKHWNTVIADGSIPSREIRQWITDSYHLAKPSPHKRASGTGGPKPHV